MHHLKETCLTITNRLQTNTIPYAPRYRADLDWIGLLQQLINERQGRYSRPPARMIHDGLSCLLAFMNFG